MVTRETRDKNEIRAFLETDRWYAAYAIADLEPEFFGQCRWFLDRRGGNCVALSLYFTGLNPHIFFLMGEPEGVCELLRTGPRPRRAYFTYRAEHKEVVGRYYKMDEHLMYRMCLRRERFQPIKGDEVRRLGTGDIGSLQMLYGPDAVVAFAPYQVENGLFYGIERDGILVAAAGTHIVSQESNIGAIGNIFTHPHYRGCGYASICTSAVADELLRQGMDVVLNVEQANSAAIHIYEKLGFEIHCPFIEGLSILRKNVSPY